jgi:opacity protein-like surface antigen
MKRELLIAIFMLVAIPALAAAAPARPGPYASAFLGVSIPKDTTISAYDFTGTQQIDDSVELDPGVFIGGTGGYDFGILRLEGELSYKHSEINSITVNLAVPPNHFRDIDGNLGVFAFMANAFVDLHNDTPVTPYLGGGIGFATLHLSDTHDNHTGDRLYRKDDATVFAYQVGGGLDIALNRLISLDLAYRYFGTEKAEFDSDHQFKNSTAEMKYESHNMAVGVRFKF